MRALDFEVGDFESCGRRAEEAFTLPENATRGIGLLEERYSVTSEAKSAGVGTTLRSHFRASIRAKFGVPSGLLQILRSPLFEFSQGSFFFGRR